MQNIFPLFAEFSVGIPLLTLKALFVN